MRLKAILTFGAIGLLVGAALISYINITASKSFSVDGLVLNEADPINGSYVYLAAGCNSCHISEEDPKKGYLAGTSTYVSVSHDSEIIDGYLNCLDPIFALISECENGRDVRSLLDGEVCHSGFKRLN